MEPDRGFIGSLLDFSFSSFVATRVIKVLYILGIIVALIAVLGLIVGAFSDSALKGIFMLLIGGPILFLIYVILIRIYLEIIIVLFRIGENVQLLADSKKEIPPSPPTITQ